MAEIPFTKDDSKGRWTVYTWTGVGQNDTCQVPDAFGITSLVTIDVRGTFGGGSVAAQGSNSKDDNFNNLTDTIGDPIAITAAGGAALDYAWPHMRPHLTGGSGSTDLTITMGFLGSKLI